MKDDLSLAEWVDPSTSALLIVDVQNDFCHSGGILGKRGVDMGPLQAILPHLQRLMEEARSIGIPVVNFRVAQTEGSEWPAFLRLERYKCNTQFHDAETYERLCNEGTWGAEIHEAVVPKPGDVVITKNRYGGFTGTNLDLILRNLGVKTLIMTGIATNVCVESTAREGFMLDYNVVLVDDACGATSPEEHEGTLLNTRIYFGRVATTDEVLNAWAECSATAKSES